MDIPGGKAKKSKKKRHAFLILGSAFLIGLAIGLGIYLKVHIWKKPTCTESGYCLICRKVGDSALGHDWVSPTCTEDGYCSRCKEPGQTACHQWVNATCTEQAFCSVCGEKGDPPSGHDWTDQSCTESSVCRNCGEVGEPATGHDWASATCTDASVCPKCGALGEPALGHAWLAATRETPKTCSRCGITEGEPLSGPSVEDIRGCSDEVAVPLDSEWLENYETRTVRSSIGNCIILRYRPEEHYEYNGENFITRVWDGEKVTLLAKRGNYHLIKTADGGVGWATSNYLK